MTVKIKIDSQRVAAEIGRTQIRYRNALFMSLLDVADRAVAEISDRIPPGVVTTSGMKNAFPGYAARGHLKNAFTAKVEERGVNTLVVSVGVKSGDEFGAMQAFVHEYGMTIRPKRKDYLVFKIRTRWVATKKVYIKPKGFFQAAMDAAAAYAADSLGSSIQEHIDAGGD